jgi:hypothetical protein
MLSRNRCYDWAARGIPPAPLIQTGNVDAPLSCVEEGGFGLTRIEPGIAVATCEPPACPTGHQSEGKMMLGFILLAVLVVVLFGAGFAVHLLWIAAVILAVVWIASFVLSRGNGASRGSLRR